MPGMKRTAPHGCPPATGGDRRTTAAIRSRPSRAKSHAVRHAAGLIDVSTLGKIEVMGRDAGLLLDRMYIGTVSDLPAVARATRVMLDEAGTVIDDGVVTRLADGRFYITTTTGGSTAIYRELQRRVAEWQLDCTLHNLTGHLAAMNLAGPLSREILAQLHRHGRWMTRRFPTWRCAKATLPACRRAHRARRLCGRARFRDPRALRPGTGVCGMR